MTITHPLGTEHAPSRLLPTAGDGGAPARPARRRQGRTLASYLVMPRPGDLVKALLMPLTFGLGVLAQGGADGRTLLRAVVLLIVLEMLVYPARYQWNDIRGFAADQRHPAEADRGRLPGPAMMARPHILASAVVAAARLATALAVAALPGLHLGGVVIAVILGVFGVAGAYEALRSAATGRDGAGTPTPNTAVVALWITVGAGYVVRGLAGLSLAVDLAERPVLGLAAAVTLWGYGVAFVTNRWAVESLAFARVRDDRVSWVAEASHAREHLLALTRWLPSAIDATEITDAEAERTACWAPLRGRTPVTAPWNLALVVAGAAAAVTGLLLSREPGAGDVGITMLLGALSSLGVILLPRMRPVMVALGAGALLADFAILSTPQPVVAVLPWLAVMAAYLHFSAQSLGSMGEWGRLVRSVVKRALTPVARLAVGHSTWELLATHDATRG
jgi:hypothetical protein